MERRRNQTHGFTLIEILVVVSIIGVLAGLVGVIIARANESALRTSTETLVTTTLATKIKQYENEMGRPPSSSLESIRKQGRKVKPWKNLGVTDGNDTNIGIELLVLQLRHPDFAYKLSDDDFQTAEEPWGNTDDDSFTETPVGATDSSAREILDAWGNPLVYISNVDYDKTFLIRNFEGVDVEVSARKRPDGTYYNENTFQLISLGPDGRQSDDSVSDDIQNFKTGGE